MKRLLFAFFFSILLTFGAQAAARFAVCTTTCTWDNVSTAMWSATSGGATGVSAPTGSDDVTLDANTCVSGTTCTITVNANLSLNSLTMGACTASTTGCILDFSVNNNNVAIGPSGFALSITGTGVRTLRMGNGTWTLSKTTSGTLINATTITNLTFNANNSTVVTSLNNTAGATIVSVLNNLTWRNFILNGNAGGSSHNIQMSGSMNSLTINGPNYIDFSGSTIAMAINNLTTNGTPSALVSINFAYFTVSGSSSATWTWLRGTNCFSAITFNNSFNGGETTGCTINAPTLTGSSACILGGWLLWRDMPGRLNDNFPAWLEKAA